MDVATDGSVWLVASGDQGGGLARDIYVISPEAALVE